MNVMTRTNEQQGMYRKAGHRRDGPQNSEHSQNPAVLLEQAPE